MFTYQLFLGRNIPTGGYVDEYDLAKFLHIVDTIVDGYTIQDAEGVWKGEHEDCMILTVCTDDKDQVLDIARTYKQAFDQEAVAIVTLPAMEFV